MSMYQYKPLPGSGAVRLLKILEGGTADSPLRCSLGTFELSHAPKFAALSYTWESAVRVDDQNDKAMEGSEADFGIECDGVMCPVRENLHDALVQLARLKYRHYIWIDAVCINQNDEQERNQQVSHMGDIYASAEATIVWLGTSPDHLDAMEWIHGEFLGQIVHLHNPAKISIDDCRNRDMWNAQDLEELGVTIPLTVWRKNWLSYLAFYRTRRWFSRAWIVQEVTLARQIIVLCRDVILNWDDLGLIVGFLGYTEWKHQMNDILLPRSRRQACD